MTIAGSASLPPRGQADDGPVVFVVDDDVSLQAGLDALFRSVGLTVQTFTSASALLKSVLPASAGCLVIDVRLPGLSGFDLQAELQAAGIHLPIVFMTGHGDIPMTVRAMKSGAVDFLEKPFRSQDMLDAVTRALERDRQRREIEATTSGLRAAYDSLTAREREVMALVIKGLMNKQIAAALCLSEITVKQHRGHVMKKMGATSLADLVRMAERLGPPLQDGRHGAATGASSCLAD